MGKILNLEELAGVTGGLGYRQTGNLTAYRVVSGDTLTRIADRFNTTVESVMRLNPVIRDRRLIVAGTVLRIRENDR